jgi:hypothetical protein
MMAKIVLANVYLVNWYGFINTKIPIGSDLTLITGENECGKSTILDAIKYAFTGDAEFNKSSSVHNVGGSRRTLKSYTRCLIDASAGTYARPADKIPNVYSHISLEYYDELNDNHFLLGVILETNASNTVSPYWYAMDQMRMDQVKYIYEDAGVLKPYDYPRFQKQYGVQMMSRKEALSKFMQMTGLKLPYSEINKFQRKLRNIMTYNPAAKIQEFIKESVLEAHDVNFDKLKDAKNNIERINMTLEGIKEEVGALEGILKNFAEHERVSTRLAIDEVKAVYKELKKIQDEIKRNNSEIEGNSIVLKQLKGTITRISEQKRETEDNYLKAKGNLRKLDCSKAIEEEEQKLEKYEQQARKLAEERNELGEFQKCIDELLIVMQEWETLLENVMILERIESDEYSAAEKEEQINHFKTAISKQKDILIEQRVLAKTSLQETQGDINHFNRVIENYNKNKQDYSSVKEQLAFVEEVNREFQRNHINSEARFACDYVVEVVEEEWREAIEAFLGVHRYSIIVEPEYFEMANSILDSSNHKYIELVNTKLLATKRIKCEEDSVLEKLIIKNEIAKKYFAYWLGRIHAVTLDDVPRYENAMSKEGKLSRNMAVTFINIRKIRTFYLGQEAIELNKKRALKRVAELEQAEKRLLNEAERYSAKIVGIENYLTHFKEYNYNAVSDYDANQKNINEVESNLQHLLRAQEKNEEFQMLNLQVQKLEQELASLRDELDCQQKSQNELKVKNDNCQRRLLRADSEKKEKEAILNGYESVRPSEVKAAIQQYNDFLVRKTKYGDTMIPATKVRAIQIKNQLEGFIASGQADYNRRKQEEERLPQGLKHEALYLARKNRIWVDDLQEINAKMVEQTRKYESIFKNEFVLSLYQTALEAKQDIADINKELRKLQFATKYQFDVNLIDDKSDYAKILRYAEYLKKTNKVDDGQMVFGNLYGYENDEVESREREIKEIINRIIDKNDLGIIQSFADYRNYMRYEIIINNEEVKDGKLSKQAGYNSGAGTQIPYTLILSAALSMLYNARVDSTRLLFIDEPFEKMSDHNIKLMLEFFKNQDFQVIFCAPPNKTDSIGYECNVIIPVIKIRSDNMQIGSVEFYENK